MIFEFGLIIFLILSLTTKSVDVYVKSSLGGGSNLCSSECDGTQTRPFKNFLQAMNSVILKSKSLPEEKHFVLLSGEKFIISPKDLPGPSLIEKFLFSNLKFELTIQPIGCSKDPSILCKDLVEIDIRTSRWQILIANSSLSFRNVKFSGLSMLYGHSQQENPSETYDCLEKIEGWD